MPSRKQKVAKAVWTRVRGFLDTPSSSENIAEYRSVRRKVEKLTENPVFVLEAEKQFKTFSAFLTNYDLNIADFEKTSNHYCIGAHSFPNFSRFILIDQSNHPQFHLFYGIVQSTPFDNIQIATFG